MYEFMNMCGCVSAHISRKSERVCEKERGREKKRENTKERKKSFQCHLTLPAKIMLTI